MAADSSDVNILVCRRTLMMVMTWSTTYSFLYLLGDIADKRFCLLRSMLPFRSVSVTLYVCVSVCMSIYLSVCLPRSFIVLKRQMISTRFLSHSTAPCLSQKIWFASVNPFLRKFCPKVTHPLWFQHRSHSVVV